MKRGPKPFQPPEGYITVAQAAERMGVGKRYIVKLLDKHGDLLGFRVPDPKGPWAINPAALAWVRAGLPLEDWHVDHRLASLLRTIGELAGPAVCSVRLASDRNGLTMIGLLLSVALLRLRGERLADDEAKQMLQFLMSASVGSDAGDEGASKEPSETILDDEEVVRISPNLSKACLAFQSLTDSKIKETEARVLQAKAELARRETASLRAI